MRNFYYSRSLETRTKSELTLTITDIFVFVSKCVTLVYIVTYTGLSLQYCLNSVKTDAASFAYTN